jgi:hypothetical protein
VSRLPTTPVALVVGVDSDGHVEALTLLAVAPSGRGGTVIPVPAGTSVPPPGASTPTRRLGSAYEHGGLAAQADAVESFLGITLSYEAVVRHGDLARVLAPYAPLHVELTDDVIDTARTGAEVVLMRRGSVTLTAVEAATVLLAHGPNESEVNRLDRTASVWRAALVRTGRGGGSVPSSPSTGAPPATVAGFMGAVAAGPAVVRPVSGEPVIDAVANPTGIDLLGCDRAAIRLLLAEVVPGAISPSNANIRMRVVNPTGDAELTYGAVQRLLYVGANVIVVSERAGTPGRANVIEYQDERVADETARYGVLFGGATVRQSPDRVDGIDATVVLGQDFRTFMDRERAKTTTTTSREETTTG